MRDRDVKPATGATAQALLAARAARLQYFGEHGEIFGEPAWDILLYLLAASERFEAPTITDVAAANHMPLSSAQRWIKMLEARGLVVVERDKLDARKLTLAPTDRATAKIRIYLESYGLKEAMDRSITGFDLDLDQ